MPDKTRAHCRACGRHRDEVGPISWSGLCAEHGREALLENVDGIHAKTGYAYARWSYGMVKSVLGNRVAFALKQAGAFDDGFPPTANLTNPNP